MFAITPKKPNSFSVGEVVYHNKFGMGKILKDTDELCDDNEWIFKARDSKNKEGIVVNVKHLSKRLK